MAIINGTHEVYVVSQNKFYYEIERSQKLNQAIAELNRQGKTIVNVSDGPISRGPVGIVKGSINILWQVDTESDAHKAYQKECEERRAQQAAKGSSGGCYIATCVYGNYDCPQVWTLRRYRDMTLSSTWYGRAFIHTYYAISPTLVKWFGHTEWFKRMWKGKLDRMVKKLQSEGVKSTPYEDRKW